MIHIFGTIFASILGLAFGSFLNVCLSRWPEGENIVFPGSHCRHCNRALVWWENIPLVSWLALRGRCRTCHAWIGWRYPLVELAIPALWAVSAWISLSPLDALHPARSVYPNSVAFFVLRMIFTWLLVCAAVLDIEHLWLPDGLTIPGAALGFLLFSIGLELPASRLRIGTGPAWNAISGLVEMFAAASLVLLLRWIYWLVRRRQGIGLGDAKLMALLAAWVGLPGALLSFVLASLLGTATALVLLARPSVRTDPSAWAQLKLPFGTFLCIGGIVTALWGQAILAVYLRWAGF